MRIAREESSARSGGASTPCREKGDTHVRKLTKKGRDFPVDGGHAAVANLFPASGPSGEGLSAPRRDRDCGTHHDAPPDARARNELLPA